MQAWQPKINGPVRIGATKAFKPKAHDRNSIDWPLFIEGNGKKLKETEIEANRHGIIDEVFESAWIPKAKSFVQTILIEFVQMILMEFVQTIGILGRKTWRLWFTALIGKRILFPLLLL